MTDRWLVTAYLLWLMATAFYIGFLIGRQRMRHTILKGLEEAIAKALKDGDLTLIAKRVVGK